MIHLFLSFSPGLAVGYLLSRGDLIGEEPLVF